MSDKPANDEGMPELRARLKEMGLELAPVGQSEELARLKRGSALLAAINGALPSLLVPIIREGVASGLAAFFNEATDAAREPLPKLDELTRARARKMARDIARGRR